MSIITVCDRCAQLAACRARILTRDAHGNHPLDVLCAPGRDNRQQQALDMRRSGMAIRAIRDTLHVNQNALMSWLKEAA